MALPIVIQDIYPVVSMQLLALIMPGNDFALILRQSTLYNRTIGIYTALGLAIGIFMHVLCATTGFSLLLTQFPAVIILMQLMGGLYLLYLGLSSFRATTSISPLPMMAISPSMTIGRAVVTGFMTNIFNPKVLCFFLSLFSINLKNISAEQQVFFLIEMPGMTLLWFSLVAIFLTQESMHQRLVRYQFWIRIVTGLCLCCFGLKILQTIRY